MDSESWKNDQEAILKGPYDYLKKIPGKDFRPQLIEAFNSVLGVPDEKLQIISKVIETLHTSSLLVDDVEDNASLRRGYPVAHSMFGIAQTINSANYMYFATLQELLQLSPDRQIIDIYTEEMINLHRGQGMDLYWRDSLTCPTEQEYISMVLNKTGGLYRLAVRLMMAVTKTPVDVIQLANLFGIIYQIQDDYLNLQSATYSKNKGFCEDLTEGKFSFPIIHSIRADETNKELLNVLRQKTSDIGLKEYAVDYMRNVTRSFDHVKSSVALYQRQAEEIIASFGAQGLPTDKLQGILRRMLAIE